MAFSNRLSGKVYLVVEDKYLIATMLTTALEEAGARAIGPVSNAEGALDLLKSEAGIIDAAILDVNLNGTMTFDPADQIGNEAPRSSFARVTIEAFFPLASKKHHVPKNLSIMARLSMLWKLCRVFPQIDEAGRCIR